MGTPFLHAGQSLQRPHKELKLLPASSQEEPRIPLIVEAKLAMGLVSPSE